MNKRYLIIHSTKGNKRYYGLRGFNVNFMWYLCDCERKMCTFGNNLRLNGHTINKVIFWDKSDNICDVYNTIKESFKKYKVVV